MSLQTWGALQVSLFLYKESWMLEGFAPTVNKTPTVCLQQAFVDLQFIQHFSEHTSKFLDVYVCSSHTLAAVTVL